MELDDELEYARVGLRHAEDKLRAARAARDERGFFSRVLLGYGREDDAAVADAEERVQVALALLQKAEERKRARVALALVQRAEERRRVGRETMQQQQPNVRGRADLGLQPWRAQQRDSAAQHVPRLSFAASPLKAAAPTQTTQTPALLVLRQERTDASTKTRPTPTLSHACPTCARTFPSAAARDQHARDAHSPRTTHACPTCGRRFASVRASAQHQRDAHVYADASSASPPRASQYGCTVCDRTFATAAARDQHVRGARHRSAVARCDSCNRAFKTAKARAQHVRDAHDGEAVGKFPPPVEGQAGKWVPRAKFPRDKGFGVFVCSPCSGKAWVSAHALRQYRQGCKSCETMHLPKWMWLNDNFDDKGGRNERLKGPHDKARCEACQLGMGLCDR